jgi:hypothetical protein
LDNTLDIRKYTKSALNNWLSENGFDLDPRQTKESKDSASYQYLIGMPMSQMTTDMVAELEKNHDDKKKERETLANTTPQKLWKNDLDSLGEEFVR